MDYTIRNFFDDWLITRKIHKTTKAMIKDIILVDNGIKTNYTGRDAVFGRLIELSNIIHNKAKIIEANIINNSLLFILDWSDSYESYKIVLEYSDNLISKIILSPDNFSAVLDDMSDNSSDISDMSDE